MVVLLLLLLLLMVVVVVVVAEVMRGIRVMVVLLHGDHRLLLLFLY